MRIAIYPGSFDPITNGHIDLIKRSLKLFDKLIVLVSFNDEKKSRFNTLERVEMIKDALKEINLEEVEVDSYNGLTLDYAKKVGAVALIRGLRVVSDFEYEWSLCSSNHFINKDIEMVFLMAPKETSFISSSAIIELAKNNVDVSSLVPKSVNKKLKELNKKA